MSVTLHLVLISVIVLLPMAVGLAVFKYFDHPSRRDDPGGMPPPPPEPPPRRPPPPPRSFSGGPNRPPLRRNRSVRPSWTPVRRSS